MRRNITNKIDSLRTQRMNNGRRQLVKKLDISVEDFDISIPEKFDTDFSSIPRKLLISILVLISLYYYDKFPAFPIEALKDYPTSPLLFLLLFLIPTYSKVDIAGVAHDFLYVNQKPVRDYLLNSNKMPRNAILAILREKWEADIVWLSIALHGKHSANLIQGYVCWLALSIFGWIVWVPYRWKEIRKLKET